MSERLPPRVRLREPVKRDRGGAATLFDTASPPASCPVCARKLEWRP